MNWGESGLMTGCRGREKTRRHTGSQEELYTWTGGSDERICYEEDKKVKYMDLRVSKFQWYK
jgi:hypothetical protein